ncbi:MAG: flagellar motor protein MotB [Candidatus Zixiibacteriota bacterium]
MAEETTQPIIIRRKKGGHGDHHGGAWKVAFADFMTAMMAFFLVMWLVGQKQEVKEAVAGYFRDPGKYLKEGSAGMLQGTSSAISASDPTIGLINNPMKKDNSTPPPSETEKAALAAVGQNIMRELEKEEAFSRLKKNVKIQMTAEGLRIILNESEDSPAFFEPGSAKLLQQSAIILITIARELGRLRNHLVMEGHTDASVGGEQTVSNWELSSDRANSARELMEVSGLYDGQVREIRGYADKFPMFESNPADPRNRRVTILVLYESRERQFDQLELGAEFVPENNG